MELNMTPRLEVATQIYARLILRDVAQAARRPDEAAHRALLFADALILCDYQSMQAFEPNEGEACSISLLGQGRPELAEALKKRRSGDRRLN